MPNRIEAAIAKQKANIETRLNQNLVTQLQLDSLSKDLDLAFGEYVKFQELKSIASTDGTLTLAEAMTVYKYLGEIPDTFNNQPLEVKVVLTQVLATLLTRHIKKVHARA